MAGRGGCGSCSAADNPVLIGYADTSTYTIGVSSARTFRGRWNWAVFPSVPCPSPQLTYWEFFNGSVWRGVGGFGLGVPVELMSGYASQNANANTWYTRTVRFTQAGTWPLRIRMVCGSGFVSPTINQVAVLPGRNIFLVD